jgi:hypothetical protein
MAAKIPIVANLAIFKDFVTAKFFNFSAVSSLIAPALSK